MYLAVLPWGSLAREAQSDILKARRRDGRCTAELQSHLIGVVPKYCATSVLLPACYLCGHQSGADRDDARSHLTKRLQFVGAGVDTEILCWVGVFGSDCTGV